MKKIVLLLFWTLLFCSASAQEKELNISFDERNRIITEIEEKIEKFISENRNQYKLTENRIDEIKQRNKEEQRQVHFSKIDEISLDIALAADKDYQLRKLYFAENPDDKEMFEKLAETQLSSLLKPNYKSAENDCDVLNGGFEEPFESGDGYNFFRLPYSGSQDFDCSLGNVENGGIAIDVPVTMNNTYINVFDTNIVRFTFTQTGIFEPSLFDEGVEIDVVNSGNRAIKLNNNKPANADDTSATRLTKVFTATDEYVSLYFNFVSHFAHVQNDSLRAPRFIFRLYKATTNEILSEFCRYTDPNNEFLFNTTNNFIYTDWQYLSLNTKGVHMNQTPEEKLVRLEVIATDCGETAHFGTLYIDDICNGRDEDEYPVYGEVEFTNLQLGGCPSFPLEICGTYRVPRDINGTPSTYGELDYIYLNILDENNDVVNTITIPTSLTNLPNGDLNTFCFTLNESDFGISPLIGGFEFQIDANFIIGGNNVFVTNTSAIQGHDICCNECCPEHVTLTGTVSGSTQLIHAGEAEHTLNAKNRIIVNASASYHAGDMVSLSPPFHINAGSSLMAYIDGCSGTYQFKKNENIFSNDGEHIALEKIELGNVESTFSIYPNPASNIINIANTDIIENVTITDMNGRVVKQVALGMSEGQINVSDLSEGVYILNIVSGSNSQTVKIIRQ